MKKQIIRTMALLLTLVMTAAAFAACGNETGQAENTSAAAVTSAAALDSTEAPETEIVPDLPEINWDRELRVLGCNDEKDNSYPSFELVAEEMTGETVNDAVFKRNETIKGKYGITVTQTLVLNTDSTITNNSAVGDDIFDLAFIYVNKVGALAQWGCLTSMNDVDYIDFSKPWWNPEVNEAVSVKGKIYYTSSDFSLRDKNRLSVLMVNDDLRESLKLAPVQDLVREGTWTAEKMLEYVTVASTDLNGDGQHTSDDQYGVVMHSYKAFASFCYGCGISLVTKDADDQLVMNINADHDSDAIDKVLAFCAPAFSMTPEKYARDWSISANTLRANRALIASTLLNSVGNFNKDVEFDFTVCPNPKYDIDQEKYYTIPDVGCMLFAIPSTVKDTSFVGFALEAFSYESTDTSYAAYIELMCKSRNLRNADSVEMINIIFDGVVYDNAIFFSDTLQLFNIVSKTIPESGSNIFLTTINSLKKAAQTSIDKINAEFGE